MPKYKYGLKPDKPDDRDYRLSKLIGKEVLDKPIDVDLRPEFIKPFMQTEQDCTANAGTANKMYLDGNKFQYSRQFLYNQERIFEGTFPEDEGSQCRTICKVLQKFGICEESYLPYGIHNIATIPSEDAYKNALLHRISNYYRVTSPTEMRAALKLGHAVLFAIAVYESFETEVEDDGFIPMPNIKKEKLLGYHQTLLVGTHYKPRKKLEKIVDFITRDEKDNYFILMNSWSDKSKSEGGWGDKGFGYLPEDVLKKIMVDAWVITK
jgi:hypothetical protein